MQKRKKPKDLEHKHKSQITEVFLCSKESEEEFLLLTA